MRRLTTVILAGFAAVFATLLVAGFAFEMVA
jgi:hypothetical protein